MYPEDNFFDGLLNNQRHRENKILHKLQNTTPHRFSTSEFFILRNRTRQSSLSVLPQPSWLTEQTLTECGILTCLCTWTIPSLKTEPNSNNKNFSCTVSVFFFFTISVLFSSSICLWIFLWYWVPSFLLVPCLSLFIYILQILRPLSPKTSQTWMPTLSSC